MRDHAIWPDLVYLSLFAILTLGIATPLFSDPVSAGTSSGKVRISAPRSGGA